MSVAVMTDTNSGLTPAQAKELITALNMAYLRNKFPKNIVLSVVPSLTAVWHSALLSG